MMFSTRLRKLREDRGYTLRKLAADAGISNPHLSQLERGQASPSAAVLERLADALGFTMHELWKGVGRCDPSGAESDASGRSGEAGPGLLVACKRALQCLERLVERDGGDADPDDCMTIWELRDAIAEAEPPSVFVEEIASLGACDVCQGFKRIPKRRAGNYGGFITTEYTDIPCPKCTGAAP